MSKWMDDFLVEYRKRQDKRDNEMVMLSIAGSQTPGRFSRLTEQLKKDVEQYNAATGSQLSFQDFSNATIFKVVRGSDALLSLHLDPSKSPLIHCTQETRANPDAEPATVQFDIHVIAKTQTDIQYRIDGNDYSDREGLSAALLAPVLLRLEYN